MSEAPTDRDQDASDAAQDRSPGEDPRDTDHPAGEEQAERNIDEEPPA